jgi:hypothetical protein
MTRAERLAKRWLQKQAGSLGRGEAEEVLSVRVDGQKVRDHLDEFARGLITSGQRIFKIVHEAMKMVESYYPPDKFDERAVRAVVMKELERRWGRDKMLPLLADMIAHGEYAF